MARRLIASRFFLACIFLLAVLWAGSAALTQRGGVGFERRPHFTGKGMEACLPCHSGTAIESVASGPHGDRSNPATPYGQEGCESCHGAGSFHVSRAYGGRGLPELLRFGTGAGCSSRETQLGACLACHENEKQGASLIGFTTSVHDMEAINCSQCHAVHTESAPMDDPVRQAGVCMRCHVGLKEGHPLRDARASPSKRIKCSACHDVHPGVKRDAGIINRVSQGEAR